MLDSKTLEWLEKREIIKTRNGFYFCGHCSMFTPFDYDKYTGYCIGEHFYECPLVSDYRDASEFEARVAAKLAVDCHDCGLCKIVDLCNGICGLERLKYARIEVEEEMSRP